MPASAAVSEASPEAAPTAETPDAAAAPVPEPAADVAPEEDAASAASSAPEPVAAEPVVPEPPVSEPAAEAAPEPVVAEAPQAVAASPAREPRKKKGWFASLFGGNDDEEQEEQTATPAVSAAPVDDAAMTLRLREAEPRLSVWLSIVLEGVDEAGDELWRRLRFLLRSLDAPAEEVDVFVDEFARWLERMEYHHLDEFRSELQYRLALALDMEDEEDERNRLFLKISDGLARTREQFSRQLNAVFSGHGELTEQFWEELEELFIMADLGYEASIALVERLRKRAAENGVVRTEGMRAVLRDEIEEIFRVPRKITAFNPPEVILFIGVNGVGKTTTIAKLAYRARMQGKKVMIAAADTFRAAAIEQLQVWADRVGALFHARPAGSDPASVAFEAMDRALAEQVDILFVDTAGRLQTKHNLMEELTKIRAVLGKKHPGAPHRTILALDATTGQNALSQAKLFKEAAGVDELILTKLDGTAKGGVAIAVAMQEHLPISYIGLGEKLEDLRPFNGDDYARALLGEGDIVGTGK
ncbi:MAG: signal recognition particle-docking protein FtsY [Desulfovibrio sp.]|uniref:signal recognition particle-docking protein FtsY n=1 Tax=Desulfovibrio sp. TaxID=885 RepID=UPI0025C696C2|nr:signal recognition particle-docking protein FtsY [Desulfovibrio sp.]MCI7569511.1 signal recognition particle-docking protein FtsY [Desulfovibrio sp.]